TPGGSTATVSVTVTCVDDPPVAVNDSATVTEDSGANPLPVLSNDTDVDGGPKSIASVTQPANGVVVITGGGTGLTYAPNANFCNNPPGTTLETFTYTLTPGGSSATVTVTVTCVNDPPVADNDTFDFIGNTDLVVDLPALTTPHALATTPSGFGVLDGDSDPVEGDPIAVTAITVGACTDFSAPFDCSDPAVGRVQMQANGRFIFTPAPGDAGATETFQYTITDSPSVGTPASATGTVTLTRFQRVWYVKNNAPAGGNGTSSSPFNSITAANLSDNDADGDLTDDLDSAGDYIFVYFGDGTATNLSSGLVLENGQHLIGEHAGLALNVSLNGNGSPTTLVAAVPGNRPLLDDTVVDAFEGVSARNVIPAEIVGMNLAGNVNAIDWTTTAAFAGSGTFTIRDNVIRSAGSEGVDINLAGTGGLVLAFYDNNLTATGNGFDLQETGTGTVTISRFDDNVVTGATGGTGINISSATFDATPGGGYQQVSGGTTVIGASGNGVGGAGMLLTNVSGDLAFTDLDIFADNGAALRVTGTGAVNTGAGTGTQVTVGTGVAIFEATNGPAVDVTNATIDLQLTSLKSQSSTTTGVSLDTVFGTFSAGSGSQITNATGTDFNINAGNAAVTYNGTISDTTGRLVSVTSTTGGTKSFTGAISDTNSGTGQGIFLNSNTGATISFSGALTLSTGSTDAFTATGGGTVSTTDTTSTIVTTTGTALNVANTTIGAGGLKFKSISAGTAASGPTNGIVLNTTGAIAGLTVSGTGSAGSGGTIQKTTGAGVFLTSTKDVSLNWMIVKTSATDGISGSSVTNFTLANSSVINNGDATTERGVEFTNLWGTASVTNSSITDNAEDNLYVTNSSGTLTLLTVSNSTFSNTSTSIGNDGIFFQGTGTAVMAISVSGSTFTNNRGDHFQATTDADTAHTATVDVVFQNNILNTTSGSVLGGGITLNPSGAHQMTFDVLNNNIQKAVVSAITVDLGTASTAAATLQGTISGNTIGTPATTDSGSSTGDGIDVFSVGAGTTTVKISGNNIYQFANLYGINLRASDSSAGTGKLNATVTGNTVSNPGSLAAEAVFLNGGTVAGDNHQICLDLGGAGGLANTLSGVGGSGSDDFRVRQRNSTTVRLPGYGGSATDTAAVVTYLLGRNSASAGTATVSSPPGGGFVGGAACAQPTLAAKRIADAVSAASASAPATPTDAAPTGASAVMPSAEAPVASPAASSHDAPAATATDAGPAKADAPATTVNVTIGTLPAGKSVTVVFDSLITGTPNLISNQGSVSGGNFSTVLTDDPDTPAPGDPTVTRVYLAVKPAAWRSGTWYLRNSLSNGPADLTFLYGLSTDVPLMCDWDGNGSKTPGVFRNGAWYLKNSNSTGISDVTLAYGLPGDKPICGDWDNDGIETVGVVRKNVWYLRNSNTSGIADIVYAYGEVGDLPVVGDWDGDGMDTPGVVRGTTWFLRNSNTGGLADLYFMYGIPPGDQPIAGDWDGNGSDTPGVLRGNLWLLRNANSAGIADLTFQYGTALDTPLIWR
ncbi:MAG: hypothetical protein KIT87_16810, partial [Anaerolineae bacterium]|nr:hypothetical protein [Anaerolineae bacterium]